MERDNLHSIEGFHLEFLRHLAKRVPANRYAVKGGCNLRFFFASARFSEDMDLDADPSIRKETLQANVRKILSSPSFVQALVARGLRLRSVSEPKQTETAQRWKITLQTGGSVLHTRIEFSRRGIDPGTATEAVAPEMVTAHNMPPLSAPHYSLDAAIEQKIRALAGRREPQARDAFDLAFLLAKRGKPPEAFSEWTIAARQNLSAIRYADFAATVLPFLDRNSRSGLASETAWERIRKQVDGGLSKEGR